MFSGKSCFFTQTFQSNTFSSCNRDTAIPWNRDIFVWGYHMSESHTGLCLIWRPVVGSHTDPGRKPHNKIFLGASIWQGAALVIGSIIILELIVPSAEQDRHEQMNWECCNIWVCCVPLDPGFSELWLQNYDAISLYSFNHAWWMHHFGMHSICVCSFSYNLQLGVVIFNM